MKILILFILLSLMVFHSASITKKKQDNEQANLEQENSVNTKHFI
jgi:hypothetical protein